jgi:hypothetical protein
LGENKRLSYESLTKLVRHGAELNHCECLSDELFPELAHILDLPLSLSNAYIDQIARVFNTLSSDHRTRTGYTKTKFKRRQSVLINGTHSIHNRQRRNALIVDPNTRIVHNEIHNMPERAQSFKHKVPETKRKPRSKWWCGWLNTKFRYSVVNFFLLILSFILFAIFAISTSFTDAYKVFGVTLLFSRGGALVILIFTMLAMFFVSYDVTTWLRGKLKGKCATIFDFQTLFHRFCGYVILTYSVIHTIGHLTGTFRVIHNTKDFEKINDVLTRHQFTEHYEYHMLLFTTLPGVTGLLLLFIILAMGITAMR